MSLPTWIDFNSITCITEGKLVSWPLMENESPLLLPGGICNDSILIRRLYLQVGSYNTQVTLAVTVLVSRQEWLVGGSPRTQGCSDYTSEYVSRSWLSSACVCVSDSHCRDYYGLGHVDIFSC